MKTSAFSIVIIAISLFFLSSCKNDNTDADTSNKNTVMDTVQTEKQPTHLYVTAPSGLTLRKHNNTQSEKLAVMLYGTKVKIVKPENETTMNVGGISGGMDKVEFNGQTGFAFNGFMSQFFPPEENASAKSYIEELKKEFPKASYNEVIGEKVSQPSKTETVLLPTEKWHEAFYIAGQLFNIPKSFAFPNPSGSNAETVNENNRNKNLFLSELDVARSSNNLQKITYSYAGKGYKGNVTITKNGDSMKIERKEITD